MAASVEPEGWTAQAGVRYLVPSLRGRDGCASYTAETRRQVTEVCEVTLHDGRLLAGLPERQLAERGFTLVQGFRSTAHDDLDKIENPPVYRSEEHVKESAASRAAGQIYFAECERLVQALTGADVSFHITHAVRTAAGNKLSSGVEYLTAYATFAHTDYTTEMLPGAWKILVKRGVPEDVARRMRVAFFNVWQPTRVPVQQHPLALLDWTSVDSDDVVHVTLGYSVVPTWGGKSKQPSIGQVLHNPKHRWYIFPEMQTDEALVFTQVDERDGFPRHSFHTAVKHASKSNPLPRQSVEVRIICGFLEPAAPRRLEVLTRSVALAKL